MPHLPEGLLNYLLACVVLALKLTLLLRVPGSYLFAYVACSVVTTACYLAGFSYQEALWETLLAILAAVAAWELVATLLSHRTPSERGKAYAWATCLGSALAWITLWEGPEIYPAYSPVLYLIRLFVGMMTIGFLIAGLHYQLSNDMPYDAISTSGVILAARVMNATGLILMHNRAMGAWLVADGIGGAVNVATLVWWLRLFRGRPVMV